MSATVAEEESRERGIVIFFKKWGKKLLKNLNFRRKESSYKKLTNLNSQSQKILKLIIKDKYVNRQKLYDKKFLFVYQCEVEMTESEEFIYLTNSRL